MGNLGGGEVLVILLVALIVLGPTKLPPAIRQVGRVVGEIRRIGQGFQQELREAAEPLQETKEALKAADKEFRDAAKEPIEEMKGTLKAADKELREAGAASTAGAVVSSSRGEGSADDSDPAAGTDPEDRKALTPGEVAEPSGDEADSVLDTAAAESDSGPDATADSSATETTVDESDSGSENAA